MRNKHEGRVAQQTFKNGEIHNWYRIVLGFSDHLVADLITKFDVRPGDSVIDPFLGSGTTAVECKKRGIDCWGVDANPSSCFAARVKTTWTGTPGDLLGHAFLAADLYESIRKNKTFLENDPTFLYLQKSGMLTRAWISRRRLRDVIAIKKAVQQIHASRTVRNALQLGLMHLFVHAASNVRFGPELYCGKTRPGICMIDEFLARVAEMEDDLVIARECVPGKAYIVAGDSRYLTRKALLGPNSKSLFSAVITSPPYPTEHDYTRNSRLELAFLENVVDKATLRQIKAGMIRSHTKGIYASDSNAKEVAHFSRIRKLVAKIEKKAATKKYGFARLYGKVTKEYFGGMRLHFRSIFPLLKPGARCAYVVGDQASYFRVKIATASILADIAKTEGFVVDKIKVWRRRWATVTKKYMSEHILLLRKPQSRASLAGKSRRRPSHLQQS